LKRLLSHGSSVMGPHPTTRRRLAHFVSRADLHTRIDGAPCQPLRQLPVALDFPYRHDESGATQRDIEDVERCLRTTRPDNAPPRHVPLFASPACFSGRCSAGLVVWWGGGGAPASIPLTSSERLIPSLLSLGTGARGPFPRAKGSSPMSGVPEFWLVLHECLSGYTRLVPLDLLERAGPLSQAGSPSRRHRRASPERASASSRPSLFTRVFGACLRPPFLAVERKAAGRKAQPAGIVWDFRPRTAGGWRLSPCFWYTPRGPSARRESLRNRRCGRGTRRGYRMQPSPSQSMRPRLQACRACLPSSPPLHSRPCPAGRVIRPEMRTEAESRWILRVCLGGDSAARVAAPSPAGDRRAWFLR